MEATKRLIGYMVTWTTYGSWLQGDERRYVKNGKTLPANEKLKSANQKQQKFQTVKLNTQQKQIVEQAILQEAQRINQKIFALAVCSNHIHLLAEVSAESIEHAVLRYKYSATAALRNCQVQNKIRAKGFDKRFCYTEKKLEQKTKYIQKHKNNG